MQAVWTKAGRPVMHVVGARPNFMKVAPVMRALANRGIPQVLVHTGQHYDVNMSDVFFCQLEIPAPDINLAVGAGRNASQTAETMLRLEPVVIRHCPVLVAVYGDVNSTLAGALVAVKAGVPVAHVESGLRSYDRSMPEEINRVLTDQIADLLFTPSADADQNLLREGIPTSRIRLVGNVMIDTLVKLLPKSDLGLMTQLPSRYVVVTLHRPSNVDDEGSLRDTMDALASIASHMPVFFPVHPRTRRRIAEWSVEPHAGISLLEPLPYLEFLALERNATAVITDSGGVQEETTYLGVPCLTLRPNTERPITITTGTNQLVGSDLERLSRAIAEIEAGCAKKGSIPPLWDGHAAERIAEHIDDWLQHGSTAQVSRGCG